MNLYKIGDLFDEVRKQYPPHYPTKMHDVLEHIPMLLNKLEPATNYIGFSSANIAIKNIIAKCINQFLICVEYIDHTEIIDIIEENIQEGKRIKIFAKSNRTVCFDLDFLENGMIIVHNNYSLPVSILGQNYSNSVLYYNSIDSNKLIQNLVFRNKSLCQYVSSFSNDGIEVKNEFKIIPKFRGGKNIDQYVFGVIERMSDFYSVSLKLSVNGENFYGIISKEDINQVNLLDKIIVPLRFLNSLEYDLNMLNPVSELDMTSLGSGGFQELVYNYLYYKDYDSSQVEEFYEEGKFIIDNAYMLELSPKSLKIIGSSLVHTPYSREILDNIKSLVRRKK